MPQSNTVTLIHLNDLNYFTSEAIIAKLHSRQIRVCQETDVTTAATGDKGKREAEVELNLSSRKFCIRIYGCQTYVVKSGYGTYFWLVNILKAKNINRKYKVIIYKTLKKPVLMYGAETWMNYVLEFLREKY